MRFVFISEGGLFLKQPGHAAVEIESPFAREAIDRSTSRNNRQAWKGQGRDEASHFSAQAVWGKQTARAETDHPLMRAVTRSSIPDELFYALAMSASSGLFRYNLQTMEEHRLFHRQDFEACGLSCDQKNGQIVFSSRNADKLGKLGVLDDSTKRRSQITDGDGHDSNPFHDPSSPNTVYFQTSGVARDENGNIVALGPASIQRLNQNSGEMTTILEDEHLDFLQPKTDVNGALYYIRRPCGSREGLPLHLQLKAFFLLPFHLASAVFGFLDAFTRMFAKRSLRPAGGGREIPQQRSRFATFHDTAIRMEKILKQGSQVDDTVQIIPSTWELVRRDPSGDERVLAKHTVSFDIGAQGEIIYSDGLRVWRLEDGTAVKLHAGQVIQSVVIV